jgi:hypothetical protein
MNYARKKYRSMSKLNEFDLQKQKLILKKFILTLYRFQLSIKVKGDIHNL